MHLWGTTFCSTFRNNSFFSYSAASLHSTWTRSVLKSFKALWPSHKGSHLKSSSKTTLLGSQFLAKKCLQFRAEARVQHFLHFSLDLGCMGSRVEYTYTESWPAAWFIPTDCPQLLQLPDPRLSMHSWMSPGDKFNIHKLQADGISFRNDR